MNPDLLFRLANLFALLIWIIIFIFPFSRIYRLLIRSGLVLGIFALGYMVIMISFFRADPSSLTNLDGVKALLDNEWAFLAGWIHYLAFDLLAGIWILNDSVRSGIPRGLIILTLIFTFMAGPFGLFLYFIVKSLRKKTLNMGITE